MGTALKLILTVSLMHLKKFCLLWKCKIFDNTIKSKVFQVFSWEIILIYYHCISQQSPISKTSILTSTENLGFQYSMETHSTLFKRLSHLLLGYISWDPHVSEYTAIRKDLSALPN